MNQRIKLLAADAGYPDYMTYGQDKVLERFAELIVKETLQIARVGMEFGPSMDEAVYTYFGIEE